MKEFTYDTVGKRDWKRKVTSEVKSRRGDTPWDPNDDYVISLALRSHPGHHGGEAKLDVENSIKPILDSVAAGLFSDLGTNAQTVEKWNYDDSNYRKLLIQRLADTSDPSSEGIAVFASARQSNRH